uniref:Taste receptor type 2 n=1 Tax=Leptobrachium leishanense TaxID=445787 RepID=A0A8C5MEP4_9ANUR
MISTKRWSMDLTFLVVLICTCIAGIMVNVFIAAVNYLDWLKGRKIKACEKVICVLALSRMCYVCISLIRVSLFVSRQGNAIMNYVFAFVHISVNYTGLWYLTLLSVLFVLKIADCKRALFIRLKAVITRRLPCFIVGVTLLAFCKATMRVWGLQKMANAQPYNLTNEACRPQFCLSILYAAAMGNFGPFVIYSVSFIMLVTSLGRHVIRMRSSDNSLSTTNLDRYNATIKSLAVCYLMFGLHVAADVLGATYYPCIGMSGFYVLVCVFPNLHSAYLISYSLLTSLFLYKRYIYIGLNYNLHVKTHAQRMNL